MIITEKKINHFKSRSLAIVIDDENQIGRAVVIALAQSITPDLVNELLHISGGTIFCGVASNLVDRLNIPEINREPTVSYRTNHLSRNHLISVEAKRGTTSGISTSDRATTLRTLADISSQPRDLIYPGHIFPVEVHKHGSIARFALAEAALDLVRVIDNRSEAVAYADLLNSNGSFADVEEANAIGIRADLPVFFLSEIIKHRLSTESIISCLEQANIPTKLGGDLKAYLFHSSILSGDHIALVKGEINCAEPVLTRIQIECTLDDLFGRDKATSSDSQNSSRMTIEASLKILSKHGDGILVYLRSQELDVLANRSPLNAHTVDSFSRSATLCDRLRNQALASQILNYLGVDQVKLLAAPNESTEERKDLYGVKIVSSQQMFRS